MSDLRAVTEFERSMIWKRQREGIELANKHGVYKGRTPTDESIVEQEKEKIRKVFPFKAAREIEGKRDRTYPIN